MKYRKFARFRTQAPSREKTICAKPIPGETQNGWNLTKESQNDRILNPGKAETYETQTRGEPQ